MAKTTHENVIGVGGMITAIAQALAHGRKFGSLKAHFLGGSFDIATVMPRPLSVAGLTNNGFKDRQLASQITISLFNVFHPRSHPAWETSQ